MHLLWFRCKRWFADEIDCLQAEGEEPAGDKPPKVAECHPDQQFAVLSDRLIGAKRAWKAKP
jgi:hypothetical protein